MNSAALHSTKQGAFAVGKIERVEASEKQFASVLFRMLPMILAAAAALLLVFSLKLPLWHMKLEAPQYRDEEALRVAVHPNGFRGDLRELSVLQQYIGVHIPATLPEFGWLPAAIALGAAAGLAASLIPSRFRARGLTLTCAALAAALVVAAVQANSQIYAIGHKRDTKTILVGVKDFTPPFFGTRKIAQFTVTSNFGPGAWFIAGALLLQAAAAIASRTKQHEELQPSPASRS